MKEGATNRLAGEASPYLQQHARNPVEWFPWGAEALARAKTEDKPILLSIGYSACHWCHVMERESFENADIAKQMNEHFVSIKVDREERPDLDHIYQLVVQLMGRSGGWPLTVFLTPEQKPFFAGTYFPPVGRYGMPSFPQVLDAVADAYQNKRGEVELQARELTHALGRVGELEGRDAAAYQLGPDLLEKVSRKLASRFDERHGGFGTRPKFPNTMCLEILLRRGYQEKDEEAKRRLRLALDGMRAGGIWDHLGGGFHRYSTDERWLVPHFEKMLYDNALLLRLYADAAVAFDSEVYAETASDIGTWLLTGMQDVGGGFYATCDADSEGEEGKYFAWTPRQIEEALGQDELAIDVVKRYFGVTAAGNFENSGATVLAENRPLSRVAEELGRPEDEVQGALDRGTLRLLAARDARVRPFRDEKILTSWNGLTIGALASAAAGLGEPSLLAAAQKAFDHAERRLLLGGRVARFLKDGIVHGDGFLDDYAYLAAGALDLYEATFDPKHVEIARAIGDEIIARFWDKAEHAFFFAPSDGENLICRTKDPFDQAVPSGGSMAALAFLKLGALVDEKYAAVAAQYLEKIAPAAVDNPFAFGQTLAALDRLVRGSTDVVIVGSKDDARVGKLRDAAFGVYLPNRNLALVDPADPASLAAARLLAEGKPARDVPVAYVCRGRTCSAPVSDPSELAALLRACA